MKGQWGKEVYFLIFHFPFPPIPCSIETSLFIRVYLREESGFKSDIHCSDRL